MLTIYAMLQFLYCFFNYNAEPDDRVRSDDEHEHEAAHSYCSQIPVNTDLLWKKGKMGVITVAS